MPSTRPETLQGKESEAKANSETQGEKRGEN